MELPGIFPTFMAKQVRNRYGPRVYSRVLRTVRYFMRKECVEGKQMRLILLSGEAPKTVPRFAVNKSTESMDILEFL